MPSASRLHAATHGNRVSYMHKTSGALLLPSPPSCEPSGLETSATCTRTDVSLAHHLALHVWGAPVWGAPVWGAPVWGAPVWGAPVWGAPVWGAPAPAGWQPGGALVAARWPSAWRARQRASWRAR